MILIFHVKDIELKIKFNDLKFIFQITITFASSYTLFALKDKGVLDDFNLLTLSVLILDLGLWMMY